MVWDRLIAGPKGSENTTGDFTDGTRGSLHEAILLAMARVCPVASLNLEDISRALADIVVGPQPSRQKVVSVLSELSEIAGENGTLPFFLSLFLGRPPSPTDRDHPDKHPYKQPS